MRERLQAALGSEVMTQEFALWLPVQTHLPWGPLKAPLRGCSLSREDGSACPLCSAVTPRGPTVRPNHGGGAPR